MPSLTFAIRSNFSFTLNVSGIPSKKSVVFSFFAASLILDADIPEAPSASGSLSPADTILILLKV